MSQFPTAITSAAARLAPSLPFLTDTGDDVNENSIVTTLHYGTFRELFMGDAGESSESRLIAPPHCHPERSAKARSRGTATIATLGSDPSTLLGMTCDDDLQADILKVGHHGSRYASTPAFIVAVHPHIAIISVGRHNTFGHPAEDTLETLVREGTSIFRTDRCGGVTVGPSAIVSTLPCSINR